MNILKEKPYIKKIITVVKNSMQRTPRKIFNNGRLSDAFVYIISGECDYFFADETSFTARPGCVIYLSNNAVYEMKLRTEQYSFIYVDFMFEDSNDFKSLLFENDYDYYTLFKRLHVEYKKSGTNGKITSMRRLYEIYESICLQNDSTYVQNTLRDKMERCKEYVSLHYDDENLSIPELSKIAEMSDVYFRKTFQSVFKISPNKYVTKVRLERSLELMKYSFLSLDEIASMCGFSTVQYFGRVFKSEFGETPAAHRKNNFSI